MDLALTWAVISVAVLLTGACLFYLYFQSRQFFLNALSRKDEDVADCQKSDSESDLLESVDVSDGFTCSQLRIADSDDVKSCSSADSRFTFYSVINSRPEI